MDIYDQEIARLADSNGAELVRSWSSATVDGNSVPISPLFQFCNSTGFQGAQYDGCGCLTQIRSSHVVAATTALTVAIKNDTRIVKSVYDLARRWQSLSAGARAESLRPFAEWQRRLDVEIRGKRPAPKLEECAAVQ
jgi:hypothetical protein